MIFAHACASLIYLFAHLCVQFCRLAAIQDREAIITRERIELILKSGANVVLTSKGIDDTALKVQSTFD